MGDIPYPIKKLREELNFLALTYGFTYLDLMNMEVDERLYWLDMGTSYHKEQQAAMPKVPRVGRR